MKHVFGSKSDEEDDHDFACLSPSDVSPPRLRRPSGASVASGASGDSRQQGSALVNLRLTTPGGRGRSLLGSGINPAPASRPVSASSLAARRRSAPDAVALLEVVRAARASPSGSSSPQRRRGEVRHASQPGSFRPQAAHLAEAMGPRGATASHAQTDGSGRPASSLPIAPRRSDPRSPTGTANCILDAKKPIPKKRSPSSERQRQLSRSFTDFHMPSLLEETLLENSDSEGEDVDGLRRRQEVCDVPRRRHSTGGL